METFLLIYIAVIVTIGVFKKYGVEIKEDAATKLINLDTNIRLINKGGS